MGAESGSYYAAAPGVCGCAVGYAHQEPAVDGGCGPGPRAGAGHLRAGGAGCVFSGFSQREVSVIYAPANQYSVILEVAPQYQRNPDALSKIYLRGAQDQLVPLESVVRMKRETGPLQINHFGQLPAVTIGFNLKPGVSLGQSAQAVEDAIREMRMPQTISANFQGTVKEFQQSFQNLTVLLIVA